MQYATSMACQGKIILKISCSIQMKDPALTGEKVPSSLGRVRIDIIEWPQATRVHCSWASCTTTAAISLLTLPLV